MKSKKIGQATTYAIFSVLIIFFLICMIAQPAKFISQALNGISAWAFHVLPSVLPFMFFTKVLSSLGTISKWTTPLAPFCNKIFKTPPISVYAFVMAILSGYPVGSKMVADLFLQGKITKQDAFKMSSFCSTSGPMFIVGAVGIGMFKDVTIGYILFVSHVIGAILNGLLYRNLKVDMIENQNKNLMCSTSYSKNQNNKNSSMDLSKTRFKKNQPPSQNPLPTQSTDTTSTQFSLADIVTNSTLSILSVGSIITIFFIVIECFSPIFSLLPANISAFLEGIIEITKGCLSLSSLPNRFLACTLCSFVISFGGISTLLQSLTMLSSVQMPIKLFTKQKITHAIFSCAITIVLCFLFKI